MSNHWKSTCFRFFSNQKGFTLIEILIVVSVMVFLSVGGITSFTAFTDTQELQKAAQDLSSVLTVAKSSAQSQIRPNPFPCGTSTVQSYVVDLGEVSFHRYSLNVLCRGSTTLRKIGTDTSFPTNITITSPSQTRYQFDVLSGYVGTANTITILRGGKSRSISVSNQGVITIN